MSEVETTHAGAAGEVNGLRSNGSATTAELQEFLGRMRGRNPQEVLGLVAKSGLVQSTIVATFGIAILLAVCTAGPYFIFGPPVTKKPEEKPAPAAEEKPAATDTAATQEGETPAQSPADVLGIGETKVAPADVNPLDQADGLDNLLDGVK